MAETCMALDPAVTETNFYCTLDTGHDAGLPVRHHRTDYLVRDPNGYGGIPATHAWDETVPAPGPAPTP